MRPFRPTAAGRETYQVKVPTVDGRLCKRTTGTTDKVTACRVADALAVLVDHTAWDVLDRITAAAPTLTVPQFYAYWMAAPARRSARSGVMMEPSTGERLEYVRERLDAVTLDSLVTAWAAAGANANYVRQVRAFIPVGSPLLVPEFRRATIAGFLGSLDTTAATKKRYRVSLSMFARALIEQGLIDANPARDIAIKTPRAESEAARAHVLRCLTMDQAKLVCEATNDPEQRALEALMAGSMIEFGACHTLMARDIDFRLRTVHADGRKTSFRSRHIEVTEDWAWKMFNEYARPLAPNTPVFSISVYTALKRHQRTCRLLKLPETTLHQYRHTFAVTWIQRGALGEMRADQRNGAWLRNQAGHSPNSMLIQKCYGVYINAVKLSAQQEQRLGLTPQAAAPDTGLATTTPPPERSHLTAMK